MKTVNSFLLISAVAVALFFSTRPSAVSQDNNHRVTKWEYHVLQHTGGYLQGELDALGQKGWELVAVTPATEKGGVTFYFKMPAG